MTPEQAIWVVARRVAADRLEDVGELWENYPELGEHDWTAVAEVAKSTSFFAPSESRYLEAYGLLAARAEDDA